MRLLFLRILQNDEVTRCIHKKDWIVKNFKIQNSFSFVIIPIITVKNTTNIYLSNRYEVYVKTQECELYIEYQTCGKDSDD